MLPEGVSQCFVVFYSVGDVALSLLRSQQYCVGYYLVQRYRGGVFQTPLSASVCLLSGLRGSITIQGFYRSPIKQKFMQFSFELNIAIS